MNSHTKRSDSEVQVMSYSLAVIDPRRRASTLARHASLDRLEVHDLAAVYRALGYPASSMAIEYDTLAEVTASIEKKAG